jgi:hypothetical protein
MFVLVQACKDTTANQPCTTLSSLSITFLSQAHKLSQMAHYRLYQSHHRLASSRLASLTLTTKCGDIPSLGAPVSAFACTILDSNRPCCEASKDGI